MGARLALVVFGVLLVAGAVLVIVAAPDRAAWGPVVGGVMILVAVGVVTMAARARPRQEEDPPR